jgi:hypothetical protein
VANGDSEFGIITGNLNNRKNVPQKKRRYSEYGGISSDDHTRVIFTIISFDYIILFECWIIRDENFEVPNCNSYIFPEQVEKVAVLLLFFFFRNLKDMKLSIADQLCNTVL